MLEEIVAEIARCEACALASARRHVVPGEGNPQARLMLVGEGPGAQEDLTGRPFVGAAGQLLDRIIAAIGLSRDEVFIANVVKCRPPGNRVPSDAEMATCLPYLRRQIAAVRPQVVVILGSTALRALFGPELRITRERGHWRERNGVWFMPTYHPAALLRDPSKKRAVWEDFKQVRARLSEVESQEPASPAAQVRQESFSFQANSRVGGE